MTGQQFFGKVLNVSGMEVNLIPHVTHPAGECTNTSFGEHGWIPETGQGEMLVRRCFLVYPKKENGNEFPSPAPE
jgi:hypothetical protein